MQSIGVRNAAAALLRVMSGQEEVQHGEVGERSAPGKEHRGADAVGAGHAVMSRAQPEGWFVSNAELGVVQAGFHHGMRAWPQTASIGIARWQVTAGANH